MRFLYLDLLYGALCLLDTIRYGISCSFESFSPNAYSYICIYPRYMHIYIYTVYNRVRPTKFKPCTIKGPGQYKGTERVARDGPGDRRGAQMQAEVGGSGYRIAYITRLSSENEKQNQNCGWSRTRFYG